MAKNAKVSPYDIVTNEILSQLKAGVAPWSQPWAVTGGGSRPLRHNGQPYTGINVLILWGAAAAAGYPSNIWMTYKQAQTYGANVRKGEKGTAIIKAGVITKEDEKTGEDKTIFYQKTYTVFNLSQLENLPPKFLAPVEEVEVDEVNAAAETFLTATGAEIRKGFTSAYYVPSQDFIAIPNASDFKTHNDYLATLSHEVIHWTGHKTRLNRFEKNENGTKDYAFEELVAEIGAAFLGADLGLEVLPREDHASYIAHWIKILDNDKRAIFKAASLAEKAVKLVHSIVNPKVDDAQDEEEAA